MKCISIEYKLIVPPLHIKCVKIWSMLSHQQLHGDQSGFFYILRYLTYLATKMHARVIFKGIQIVRININHNLLYSSAFLMTCCFVGCHS